MSIVEIVLSVFALGFGALNYVSAGAIASMSPAELASAGLEGVTAEEASMALMGIAIISIVSSIWGLLCGIFGIRAANNNQKIMVVWVFLLIAVILDAVDIIYSLVNGSFQWSALLSLAVAVFMWWIANNVKKEAGK